MNDRDCENCKHHTKKGCDSWDCKFERKVTRKEAIKKLKDILEEATETDDSVCYVTSDDADALKVAIDSLEIDERYELEYEQIEPCEMTAEEYRQRMIQAFHNADTDELIAICVLPTEKEFEHLEWLLKNHYKKEPCEDAISRQAVLDATVKRNSIWNKITNSKGENLEEIILQLPPVNPQEPRKGYLSIDDVMSVFDDFMCGEVDEDGTETFLEMLKDKAESEDKE